MKAIKFKGVNTIYAESQDEYFNLPALKFPNDPKGLVITCWKLNFWERLRVLFLGKIWASQLTFNNDLQPINKSTKRTDFFTYTDKKTFSFRSIFKSIKL